MPFHRSTLTLPFWILIACLGNAVIPSHAAGQSLSQRVLVVYNTNFADSLTVANHYMAQRGIPAANLCAITPPSSIEITMTDYVNTVKTPIRTCLTNAGRTNILYIVFSYLAPYRVSVPNPYFVYSLDSFVSDIWDQYTTQLFNPAPTAPHRYYAASQSQGNAFLPFVSLATYRTQPKATLLYSVWRLDAATLALAEGLVDKAMQAESAGGPTGQGCFDGRSGDPNLVGDASYGSGDWTIHAAALFMSQAGIAVTEDTNFAEFGTAPAPLTCPNAAFYSGWYSFDNYNDAFTWNTGAIGFHLDSASAVDPRGGLSWSPNAVIHGITVTSGSVTEPYLEGLPQAGRRVSQFVGRRQCRRCILAKHSMDQVDDHEYRRPAVSSICQWTRPFQSRPGREFAGSQFAAGCGGRRYNRQFHGNDNVERTGSRGGNILQLD